MKIQESTINFKRALTTKEKQAYMQCIRSAKKELSIRDTTAIIFDYLIPSEAGKNLGIGSSLSDNAQKFANFLKELCGIDSMQLNPQGILKDNTVSPYSSASFSIGEHIIDLFKLTEQNFRNLLKPSELKKYVVVQNKDKSYKVDYEKLVRQDYKKSPQEFVYTKLLNIAFERFKQLDKNDSILQEFRNFCNKNTYWLDGDSLYYALSEKYGSTQWQNWNKTYQDLYLEQSDVQINNLKKELKEQIDYFKFVQFIANKQQQIAKKNYNDNGLKIYGDIPISFSPSVQWRNKNIFSNNYSFGYYFDNKFLDWGSPAPDLDRFNDNESRKNLITLFNDRLKANLKRYDGVRIDAAWEMVNPCIVKWSPQKSEGKIVDNINDELLNELERTAKNVKGKEYNPEMLFFELIGDDDIIKTVNYTKNKFPHTLITGNVYENMGTVNNYLANGYKDGKFTVGIGTHDNCSLIELSKKINSNDTFTQEFIKKDLDELSKNMKISKDELKKEYIYRKTKLAEIFTTQKQFLNIFDILGLNKSINKWDCNSGDYWKDRVPINYEKTYFKNLTLNKGLNLPEVLKQAMQVKEKNKTNLQKSILQKLEKFSLILKEKGPLTEKEANLSIT